MVWNSEVQVHGREIHRHIGRLRSRYIAEERCVLCGSGQVDVEHFLMNSSGREREAIGKDWGN